MGGSGKICQIDESLLCHKPKNHRGRSSTYQIWCFGIVDTSTSPSKGYVEIVPNRSSAVLLPIISRVCRPGSIIYSDEWRAYNSISDFAHFTVNHSLNFVNPETGVHTQNIESYWNKIKLNFKTMKGVKKSDASSFLIEFMWRERVVGNSFLALLRLISSYF